MQLVGTAALAFLLCLRSTQGSGHPVEKVIGLLQDLAEKVKQEGGGEEISYAKFQQWCSSSTRVLTKAVDEGKEKVEVLEDFVSGKKKEIATLEEEIKELEADLKEMEGAGKGADEARKKGAEAYKEEAKDIAATIDAVDQAIKVLQEAKDKVSLADLKRTPVRRALALLQAYAPEGRQADVAALLLQEEAAEAPAAAPGDAVKHQKKYTFKSGNVIDLLKQLKMKFKQDAVDADQKETNAQNAYELQKKDRENMIAAATKAKEKKSATLADSKSALADAEASLKDAKEDLEADTKSLGDTEKTCTMKNGEWEERSAIRAQELEAIEQAIKILAKVTGVRTEPPSNPVPPPSPVKLLQVAPSFLQIADTDPKARVVNLLRSKAKQLRSKTLEHFVQQLAARLGGPFTDISTMIQKLIFRLMKEQKDEDEHKNWCDIELEKTNSSLKEKKEAVELLGTEIEEAKAKIAKLSEEIAESQKMVASIDTHVAEAKEIRVVGMTENKDAIREAEQAQVAIGQAIAVLEDFYKESGMIKSELLQRAPVKLSENPSTWDASYTGVADPKAQPDGIITVLESVSADFAKMESDTKAQEATDAMNHEASMKECALEKDRRMKEIDMKNQDKSNIQDKVTSMEKKKKNLGEEIYTLEQYFKDLQPACVEGDSTYEDRKKARNDEIEALKQAKKILEDYAKEKEGKEGAFLQPRRSH